MNYTLNKCGNRSICDCCTLTERCIDQEAKNIVKSVLEDRVKKILHFSFNRPDYIEEELLNLFEQRR